MLPETTATHYREQQSIAALTAAAVRRQWQSMGDDFDSSWAAIRPQTLQLIRAGQLAAATTTVGYVQAVLEETGQDGGDPAGAIIPAAFADTASDGRDLGDLLDSAPLLAKTAVGAGATTVQALERGRNFLTMAALTQVADASREVVAADMGAHPLVTGYVRMLNPPSCSRCVILAGKWFRYNQGFQRHPRCDCRHIPATENLAGDFTTDPYAYFKSLTSTEQSRMFGRSGARAINDGADIYRVVNLEQRGLAVAGSRQAIKYGTPTRVTVDQIYRTAGTRTNAIRLLRENGYITGPQRVGGNIRGQREGFGSLGKGGRANAASAAVVKARVEGRRDQLNRYTMTEAERRLYDAKVRLDAAEQQGVWLRSVGANSADQYTQASPVTPKQLALLRRQYATQVGRLTADPRTGRTAAPASVQALARRLGIL